MEKIPEPYTSEMWAFLLTNSLKYLDEDQLAGLCFDLYERSVKKSIIDEKIELFKLKKIM